MKPVTVEEKIYRALGVKHSNITMTLNYYAHADYASAKAAMDRLAV